MKKILFAFFLLTVPLGLFAKDVITILYFDNTTKNADYDWLKKGLADMLISDVASTKNIEVVERENLQKIIQEQKLALSGFIDEDQAVELGKLLSAKKMIYGGFVVQGDSIRVDAKITDVETGKILNTLKVSGSAKDVFDLVAQVSEKILIFLGEKAVPAASTVQTTSVNALKAYYEGVDFLDNGAADKAIERFQTATKYDPLFTKPQKGLEDAYKFLKDFKKVRYQREINELYHKVSQLRKRLAAKEWKTYGEIIMERGVLPPEEEKKWQEENIIYLQCDTPAVCTWNLMLTLIEIGGKYEEYYEDEAKRDSLLREAVRVGDKAEGVFKNDSFLGEILYVRILALYQLHEYELVKAYAEDFMLNFPSYRLIEAVENFYERSLEELKDKTK